MNEFAHSWKVLNERSLKMKKKGENVVCCLASFQMDHLHAKKQSDKIVFSFLLI